MIPALDPAVFDRDIKSQWNRGRRVIAKILNGADHFLLRQPQIFGGRVNDPLIGLMGDDPIDLFHGTSGRLQRFLNRFRHRFYRQFEYFPSAHHDFALGVRLPASPSRYIESVHMGSIDVYCRVYDSFALMFFTPGNDKRSCSVTEQDASGLVCIVRNPGQRIRPDDQNMLVPRTLIYCSAILTPGTKSFSFYYTKMGEKEKNKYFTIDLLTPTKKNLLTRCQQVSFSIYERLLRGRAGSRLTRAPLIFVWRNASKTKGAASSGTSTKEKRS
jgi:hypothetical protein